MSEFRGKVLRALSWTAGGKVLSQVISIGFGIALARMLTPDDFGLIAMMMVFTGFAGLLTDVGLGSALVQRRDITESHYNTVFWANLGMGIGLCLVLLLFSPYIADFYKRPELTGVGYVMSLQFVLGALALVPRQRLVKTLVFKTIAVADLVGMVVAGIVAIAMVHQGFGYWALAWHPVILRLVATAYIWLSARWVPELEFSMLALRDLFGFSFYVFATRVIRFITDQADKLLAGRFLGGEAVGLLDKAQSMMLFPLQNISHTVGSVMFPALSMVQTEKERVRSIYLRSTQAIALLAFPMMAGMFAVADAFVLGVLGPQWEGLVPVLRILCIAGIARSIVTVTGAVYLSQGKAKLQFKVNLLTRPIALGGVVAGLPWGIEGIAIGATAATMINSYITLRVAGSLINLTVWQLIRGFLKTIVASIAMAACVITMQPFLAEVHPLVSFLVQVLSGVAIFALLAIVLKIDSVSEITGILRSRFRKSS